LDVPEPPLPLPEPVPKLLPGVEPEPVLPLPLPDPLPKLLPELEPDPVLPLPDPLPKLLPLLGGVLPDVPLLLPLLEPDRSACRVCSSSWPEAVRPLDCWYWRSASRVFSSQVPLVEPGSNPAALSWFWTSAIVAVSMVELELDPVPLMLPGELDVPEDPPGIPEEPLLDGEPELVPPDPLPPMLPDEPMLPLELPDEPMLPLEPLD
jgi:hypothetical protein